MNVIKGFQDNETPKMPYEKALEFAKGGLQTYYEKYPELTEQIEFQEAIIDALEKVIELQKQKKKTYKQIKTVLYHTSRQAGFDQEANEALEKGWTLTKRTAMQKGDGSGTILIAELEKEVEIDEKYI